MEAQITVKNRLTDYFLTKNKNLLNIYFTAGFPHLNDTVTILKALQKAGVDMVEIGLPFSDPLADGPTIQRSSEIALRNGMSTKLLFHHLKEIRKEVDIPLLLLGYINPVIQYGVENFCRDAAAAGIDGLVLPDLPFDEYQENYREIFESYNLSNVFLVTPHTSPERVSLIDKNTNGFIYVVSTDSTTGNTKNILDAAGYFERIKNYNLKNPFLIGFNINNAATFNFANRYANGAIIGSAFIKMLATSNNIDADIVDFVQGVRNTKD